MCQNPLPLEGITHYLNRKRKMKRKIEKLKKEHGLRAKYYFGQITLHEEQNDPYNKGVCEAAYYIHKTIKSELSLILQHEKLKNKRNKNDS